MNPPRRRWLIFFHDCQPAWWARMFRPGFRHVVAASYYADQKRWVYVNPSRHGTVIEVQTGDEFGPRFQQLMTESAAVLAMPSRHARRVTPAMFHCVGAIKALLGVRCRAVTPHGLFRALIAAGAEKVERAHVECIRQTGHSGGRPGDRG